MAATLSTTAWVVHNTALATSIGGTLFGRIALQPALHQIARAEERDHVSADAWRRFSWINLLSHVAFASTWFTGRTMLSGRAVSRKARTLTRVKDVLMGASLVTGVASNLLGRKLGQRGMEGRGPQAVREGFAHDEKAIARTQMIQRSVGVLGMLNLIVNSAISAVTTVLAMEGSKSARFATRTRWLP